MTKKMSIKKIAELSGVSVATVSRVINNTGRFSEDTRQRVMEIIKKYEYEPNMVAKSLRVNKSKTIGVTVPDISNGFFSEVVSKIETFFFENGYSVFICNTNNDVVKEKEYFKSLSSKLVDGIICISGNSRVQSDLIEHNIPIVYINNAGAENCYCVESDHYMGGYKAAEALIKGGCKKLLMLTNDRGDAASSEKYDGFKKAHKHYNIEFDERLYIRLPHGKGNFEEAYEAVSHIIDENISFDGIFATNDWRAHGALEALHHRNILVPDDVKIIGYDGTYVSKYCNPAISTIYQDKTELALRSSEILLKLVNEEEVSGDKHLLIPVKLIERETT